MHKDSDGRDESVLEAVYGRIVSPSMACPVPLDNAGARCELDADGASVEAPLLGSCELRIFHHGRGIRRGTLCLGISVEAPLGRGIRQGGLFTVGRQRRTPRDPLSS